MIQQIILHAHNNNNNNEEDNELLNNDENIVSDILGKRNLSPFFELADDKYTFCDNNHGFKKTNKKKIEIKEDDDDDRNDSKFIKNDEIHPIKPKNISLEEQVITIYSSENNSNSSMGYQGSAASNYYQNVEMFQEWTADLYQKICNEEEIESLSHNEQFFEKKEMKKNKKEKKFHEESIIWIQKMNANQKNEFTTFLANIEKRMIIPNHEFNNEKYFFLNDLFLETDIFSNNECVKKWFVFLETYRLFTLCVDIETCNLSSHAVLFDMCLEKATKKTTEIYNQKKESIMMGENIKKEKILSSIKNIESLIKQDFEKKTISFNEKINEFKQRQKKEKEEFERHQKMEYDQFEQEIKKRLKLENIQEEIQIYEMKKKEESHKNEIVLSLF